jgi:hypothetical protein
MFHDKFHTKASEQTWDIVLLGKIYKKDDAYKLSIHKSNKELLVVKYSNTLFKSVSQAFSFRHP